MKLKYDLHIHSCLSPCGNDDMTPANIAAMAALAGYGVIGLSDHNSVKNCRAMQKACEENGLVFLPGMELTTEEEVHVLCLFPTLESAEAFGEYVYTKLPDIKNKPEFFGEQHIYGEDENVIGVEEKMLIGATSIGTYDVAGLVESYGGVAIPAHIDRSSFSLLSNLGYFDGGMGFRMVEITRQSDLASLVKSSPRLAGLPYMINSDAHALESMPDPLFTLEAEGRSAGAVFKAVISGKLTGIIR